MKVLVNALLLTNKYSGVQHSIEYLLDALSKIETEIDFTILVSRNYKGCLKENVNFILKRVPFKSSNRVLRILYENTFLPHLFKIGNFDLYHSPGYTLPYFFKIPSIVTVHDLIALSHPSLCMSENASYFRRVLPRSLKSAKKIIAVSHSVKKDILNRFTDLNEKKIAVIYHGIHDQYKKECDQKKLDQVRNKYSLPDKFLLFVGNIEPKKNISKIIEAFNILKQGHNIKHGLVIAGQFGWKYSSVLNSYKKSIWQSEIQFIKYVDQDDLPSLYSLADVFVFPSLHEGFGLPVLESMACGCPVIVSDRGSLPEIAGNHCPVVNPYSPNQIAEKMLRIISDSDLRHSLIESGYGWVERFKWQSAAQKTLDVYTGKL